MMPLMTTMEEGEILMILETSKRATLLLGHELCLSPFLILGLNLVARLFETS